MADTEGIAHVVRIAETWEARRRAESRQFTADGLRGFVETQNALTRLLMSELGIVNNEVWSALAELCRNAEQKTTPGAKTFADGRDVTNV